MLEVRAARPDEFDAVLDFYTEMIDQMQGTDFDVQWKHGVHPSPEFLRSSLEMGQVVIGLLPPETACEEAADTTSDAEGADPVFGEQGADSVIACALVVNHEGASGYDAVPWAVNVPTEQVGVLHVVATLPTYHGRGLARQLVNATADLARARGLAALRLDTFPHNVRGRGLYESCGFEDKGEWTVHYPSLGDTQVNMYELAL